MRLSGDLPPEVKARIKEYAQPVYRKPIHFNTINTLFQFQKRDMMENVICLMCPSSMDTFCRTRFNYTYRNAMRNYQKQHIGEIYEWLTQFHYNSPPHNFDFKIDIINRAQTLKQDLLPKTNTNIIVKEVIVVLFVGLSTHLCFPMCLYLCGLLRIPLQLGLDYTEIAVIVVMVLPLVLCILCWLAYTVHVMSKLLL